MKPKVIFRADGNSAIGLGHIYRCISILEMLKSEFECSISVKNINETLLHELNQYGKVLKIEESFTQEEEINLVTADNDIIVLDGYHFSPLYQKKIKDTGRKLVLIDDLANELTHADVVINHCSEKIAHQYEYLGNPTAYSGLKFAILRPEFMAAAKAEHTPEKNGSCFVCLGGADPLNLTLATLKTIHLNKSIKMIHVVTGSAYPFSESILKFIEESPKKIYHHQHISASALIGFIKTSQVMITSASSIAIEVAAVKGALICGITADNQKNLYEELTSKGCCLGIGEFADATSLAVLEQKVNEVFNNDTAEKLFRNQQAVIDGLSGTRILNLFHQLL